MRKGRGIRLLALILALVMLFAVPVAAEEEDVVIVLDPGHGGLDSGTEMKYDASWSARRPSICPLRKPAGTIFWRTTKMCRST